MVGREMKKWTLMPIIYIMLALLLVIALFTTVMASPGIAEPSFETVSSWAYSASGANFVDGPLSADWQTQGSVSYKISSTLTINVNEYGQILQQVEFTSIDTLSFDANLWCPNTGQFRADVLVGGVVVWTQTYPVTATDYLHQEVDVSGYTGTLDLIFRVTGIKSPSTNKDQNSYFDNIRIWGSYSNSGRTTVFNTFTTYGSIVYMYGESFDTTGTYKVAYYDGGTSGDGSDGAKLYTDVYTNLAGGILDLSQVRPADYMSSARAGTWHAVVYKTTESMPNSYDLVSTGSANYTVTDSFTVAATAIPEFPTVIAAIGVAGLCFGIYWWMRRRRLESCRLEG